MISNVLYLLPIQAGWFITFVAVVIIIGLLIGILKILNRILIHLQSPKLIWSQFVPCKHCSHVNELDYEEQCSESFTCSVCRKDNHKE